MISSAVLTAVRERYERMRLDIPRMNKATTDALTQYERVAAAEAMFKQELRELHEFLEREGETVEKPVQSNMNASANLQILLRAKNILSDGRARKTVDLHEELLRQGQVFTAQNSVARLSQLLSGSDWFVSDRTQGWSLKGEAPGATGASGATESDGS